MNIHSLLRETAMGLLVEHDKITVAEVVAAAEGQHPEAFTESARQLVVASAKRIVRDVLRDLSEDDDSNGQLLLPGMTPMPSVIAVRSLDEETYYRRTDKATWPELVAGRAVRSENVAAAQKHLDQYDQNLDVLRPVMADAPRMTVAAALRILRKSAG